ncbi:MAG: DUF488 family protein, partial [Tepidiformaceae bacterium]
MARSPEASREAAQVGRVCPGEGPAIFTVGHSTRPIGAMLDMLRANHIDLLVDVRTVPRSRHNPQYSREALVPALSEAGIEYQHEAELGGLRRPRPDSINGAWHNESFRGFADHMRTPQFNRALDELLVASGERRIALLCAEGNPFRCHRSLIADAILARGLFSCEIAANGRPKPHQLTSFARIENQLVKYPPSAP